MAIVLKQADPTFLACHAVDRDIGAIGAPISQVLFRFTATDLDSNGANIVEALVDDIVLADYECGSGPGPGLPPNDVGNTLKLWKSGPDLLVEWTNAKADALHDPATAYDIYRAETAVGPYTAVLTDIPQGSAKTNATDAGTVPGAPVNSNLYLYRAVSKNTAGQSLVP